MKVAYHFREEETDCEDAIVDVLSALLSSNQHSHTKVFIGTLLFWQASSDTRHQGDSSTSQVNIETLRWLVSDWLQPHPLTWHALSEEAESVAMEDRVYAICLETLDASTAIAIHRRIETKYGDNYLGALEVVESIPSHLAAYQLCTLGRVESDSAAAFWDGISEDSKMEFELDIFRNAGYRDVKFESLAGRYSIIDADHGHQQSKRIGETRIWMRELFDGVADHTIGHLSDGAPDIAEKVWNALKRLRDIQIEEEAAAVALACRRIFESVANSLFPPTDDDENGRKLGTEQFKNRLLKYLELQHLGKRETSLIEGTMRVVAAEVDYLLEYSNKGVHGRFERAQARRCLLRTILLLDDLVSVRHSPLAIQIRPDMDWLKDSH